MKTPTTPFKEWQKFAIEKETSNYPKWPNEIMLKVLFGNYLTQRPHMSAGMRVLDVGCGFGNNLLPFLDRGMVCTGTEVTQQMATQTEQILKKKGFSVPIRVGVNQQLPFADDSFDLLLSIGVIHYEDTYEKILQGLAEYKRVLTPSGRFFLITAGVRHDIIRKAKRLKDHVYQIQQYDFRDGSRFYCFETTRYLKKVLLPLFRHVEVGRVTEKLMTHQADFLIATGEKPHD